MAATVMNPLLDPGSQPRKHRILAHLQPPFLPLLTPPPRPGADPAAVAGSGETRMRRRSSTLSDYFRSDGLADSVAVDGKRRDESPVAVGEPYVGGEREEFSRDDEEDGDFWSPRDTGIIASCCSSLGTLTPHSEFYDAVEGFADFGSDSFLSRSSSPSSISTNKSEFHYLYLVLSEEIERRKTAEAALLQMQRKWQGLAEMLSRFGVSLPAIQKDHGVLNDLDFVQISQDIISAKSASEATAGGAEAAANMEPILEAKNRDLSRLQNRVNYFLIMNREMSLRNQELACLSCLKNAKRRQKYRWIWSCLGLSFIVGSSLLASSYSDYSS